MSFSREFREALRRLLAAGDRRDEMFRARIEEEMLDAVRRMASPGAELRDAGRTWAVRPDSSRVEEILATLLPGRPEGQVRFALAASHPCVAIGAEPRLVCTRCGQRCWWTPGDQDIPDNPLVLCTDCTPADLKQLLLAAAPPEANAYVRGGKRP